VPLTKLKYTFCKYQYFSYAERHLGNALQNWHFSNANQHLIIENYYFIIADRILALQNFKYQF
jgi:hypothetical protein